MLYFLKLKQIMSIVIQVILANETFDLYRENNLQC